MKVKRRGFIAGLLAFFGIPWREAAPRGNETIVVDPESLLTAAEKAERVHGPALEILREELSEVGCDNCGAVGSIVRSYIEARFLPAAPHAQYLYAVDYTACKSCGRSRPSFLT